MATWMTYIGGSYRSEAQFIREAQTYGVSRRVPLRSASGFAFGDRVILLRYGRKGVVWAFGEFKISGLMFDPRTTMDLAEILSNQFKLIAITGGGGTVRRACGSYEIGGRMVLDDSVTPAELVRWAQENAKEHEYDAFCMVSGEITRVYEAPVLLQPAPKFSRGFFKADDTTYEPTKAEIVAVEGYQRAKKRSGRKTTAFLDLLEE
jgi:hypothetical protein